MRIGKIVDYGTGNIGSIAAVFSDLGWHASVATSTDELASADLAILPGVGAAGGAMRAMRSYGIIEALRDRYAAGRPVLGICLGAQVFGRHLEEDDVSGLDWIDSDVTAIGAYPFFNIGWRQLDWAGLKASGLGRGLTHKSTFYFNHRYCFNPTDLPAAVAVDGSPDMAAILLGESLCAVQFHPEKSQRDGRVFLRNVLEDYFEF